MKSFSRLPKSASSRRLLPGHGLGARSANTAALPGVDPRERRARRHPWTAFRAEQRARFGLRDHLGLAGAALALVLMLSVALAPRPNVLDTSADAAPTDHVEVVDAHSPASSSADVVRL